MDCNIMIESVSTDFPKCEIPMTVNLSSVLTVCWPVCNCHCEVAYMQPAKKVKNGKELHMQEVMFVDPSATMKLVPWEEHVDTVAAGNTYSFEHTGVKKTSLPGDSCQYSYVRNKDHMIWSI